MKHDLTGNPAPEKRLAAVNRRIAASLDFEKSLGLIADSGLELVGADSCLVLLREGEDQFRVCAAQGVDPATAARFKGSMGESVLGELRQYLGLGESESISAFPVMSGSLVQGILVVVRRRPLDAEETRLVSSLADQAAISLQNAHRHESLVSRETRLRDEVGRFRKLSRELEASIHSAARELRVPLRTLTGSAERLLEESGGRLPADRDREHLVRIVSGARKMEAVIQDLLTYTRLDGADLALEPVDLTAAVSEAVAGFQAEIESRGGLVQVESLPLKVLADGGTLAGILRKFMSNALGFVDPGEPPRLELRTELLGKFVRVTVLDNGKGVRETSPDRGSEAGEGSSAGIGPALIQRGAERMGGRCGVESEPGKGRRFWIELLKSSP